MSFDISSYLSTIDPKQPYNIDLLTGGVVNTTARASRCAGRDATQSRFPDSFILKHALPYVAGIGPEAPFSTFRQTIEARALSLFLPSSNSLSHLCEESGIMVPTLLHHDQQNHVLIISDLGPLPDLSGCFGNLSSISLTQAVSGISIAPLTPESAPISPVAAAAVGQKLGFFFAGLHQPKNVQILCHEPYNDSHFLTHEGMLSMVFEAAIRPVKEQLLLFPQHFPEKEVLTAYQRLEDNFTRETENDERVIALGDCWTGAVLVGARETLPEPQVGIIDWEFASIGRGVNGDMAQLLAHLHLFLIAAAWQKRADSLAAINAILQGITVQYRRRSHALNAPWLPKSASSAPEPVSMTARLMRSAFLAHGAEMITNAFWKQWPCDHQCCCGEKMKDKQFCELIQDMVKKGWWYLHHARDEMKFVDSENWDMIRHESVILPLFLEPNLGDGLSGPSP